MRPTYPWSSLLPLSCKSMSWPPFHSSCRQPHCWISHHYVDEVSILERSTVLSSLGLHDLVVVNRNPATPRMSEKAVNKNMETPQANTFYNGINRHRSPQNPHRFFSELTNTFRADVQCTKPWTNKKWKVFGPTFFWRFFQSQLTNLYLGRKADASRFEYEAYEDISLLINTWFNMNRCKCVA